MEKLDFIRMEMETRGAKEATTITSEKEGKCGMREIEAMIEIEALKREIAWLNKKVSNPKPVRDELALSRSVAVNL